MGFMCLLLLIVFVAVVCTAREIVRYWRRNPPEYLVPLHSTRSGAIEALRSSAMRKRHARWISMNECEKLVHTRNNVVFIAIKSEGYNDPPPFPGVTYLSVSPNQLIDVLRWLPPGACVVLDGEIDPCCSVVEPLDRDTGSASLYLLRHNRALAGVG
jgi:hypothetical protein